jgi:excisionase family DNA binding protein
MPAQIDRLLTVKDLVQITQSSQAKIYADLQKGLIPSVKIGGAVRVRESSFYRWLEEHERGGK